MGQKHGGFQAAGWLDLLQRETCKPITPNLRSPTACQILALPVGHQQASFCSIFAMMSNVLSGRTRVRTHGRICRITSLASTGWGLVHYCDRLQRKKYISTRREAYRRIGSNRLPGRNIAQIGLSCEGLDTVAVSC